MVLISIYKLLASIFRNKRSLRNRQTFDDCYFTLETVSENSDSEVHILKVKRLRDGGIYCAKVFNKSASIKRGDANEHLEIKYLKHFRGNPNIVQIVEFFDETENIVVINEFLDITLYDILKIFKFFPEEKVLVIARVILKLLSILEKEGLVHGDLILQNFMLKREDDPFELLKMVDFNTIDTESNRKGCHQLTKESQLLNSQPSSLAPETITNFFVDHKSDMWSAGVIFYTLLYGTVPFQGMNQEQIYSNILNNEPTFTADVDCNIIPEVSPLCKEFVSCLLEKNQTKRLSASQALQHPWVTQTKGLEQ